MWLNSHAMYEWGMALYRHQMETFSALLVLCEGIPLTKSSDAELWCFPWSAPEQAVEQTIDTLIISDAIALIMTSLVMWHQLMGLLSWKPFTGISLGMRPDNERRRYIVTTSLIGCAHTWTEPCLPCNQVFATHLKIGQLPVSSTCARSSNELQRLDLNIEYQDSSSSNVH